jgi:hypothetical protein
VGLPASDSTCNPNSARMRQSKPRYSCNTVAYFTARVTSRANGSSHPSEAIGPDLRVKNSHGDLEPGSDDGGEATARLLTEALGDLGAAHWLDTGAALNGVFGVISPPPNALLRLFGGKSCLLAWPASTITVRASLCHHFQPSCLRTRPSAITCYRPDGGFLSLSILLGPRTGHQPPAQIPVSPGTDIPKTMARAAPHAWNRSHSFALVGTWRRPHGAATLRRR